MARLFHEVGVVALIILLAAAGRAGAQVQNDQSDHLGVAPQRDSSNITG